MSGNSTIQTAWSNYGFIPFLINYGGSTGGVSSLEPLPWYQAGRVQMPSSYPYGGMVPDVSLSASPYPGTWVVYPGNYTGIFGGTSEASPLLAGMLTVAMQAVGHRLGLLNPFLYSRGYSTGSVDPVTFGYNIPWIAGPGYNLVTGLGIPNAGMMALAMASRTSSSSLNITIQALNSSMEVPANDEFFPGQEMVIAANATLNGEPVIVGSFNVSLVTLQGDLASTRLQYNSTLGEWIGNVSGSYPYGPMVLETQGAYGYLPFMQGADLQGSLILPQVVAEPGSVAPEQYVFVDAIVIPPLNMPYVTGLSTGFAVPYNVMYGSNVTVELLNPSGVEVASATAMSSPTAPGIYEAAIMVPPNSKPGIYTVILTSSYNSITLGEWVNGSFFGQIYVSPPQSTPRIEAASSAYEGQTINVEANITYANGTEVRYGMYVASVYSSDLQSEYGQLASSGIPLHYDPSKGLWVGSVQLPSPYALFAYNATTGNVAVGPQGYSGPYDVFVTGISWDGVPTNASLSAQRGFYIYPMIFIGGRSLVQPVQTSGLALMDDNVTLSSGAATMSGDVFMGVDSIEGPVSIYRSTINGTLYLRNSTAVLEYVSGGNLVAVDSEVTLVGSHVSSLTLINSTVSMQSSSASSLSPAPPSIDIVYPVPDVPYDSTIPVEVNVTGQAISSVSVSVDGFSVYSASHGGSWSSS